MPFPFFHYLPPALGYLAAITVRQHIEFEKKFTGAAKEQWTWRQEEINTLFVQRGFDLKNGEIFAGGCRTVRIDPLRYEWDEELIKIATILSRERDRQTN